MIPVRANEELRFIQTSVRKLEATVPPPIQIPVRSSFEWRYTEKTVQQAVVLKCARLASGLRALFVLHNAGMFQEQGAHQRSLDETTDAIQFLVHGVMSGLTPLHDRWLAAFWDETFTELGNGWSAKQRSQVKSQDIRAYNTKSQGLVDDPAADLSGKALFRIYSGFVHGSADRICEMYAGSDGFLTDGLSGTPLESSYARDAMNYVYRSIAAICLAAMVLEHREVADVAFRRANAFAESFGC